jgi:oxaloacetate decarboxylase alpha subunit
MDRIVSNASRGIALEPKPLEPMLPLVRKRYPKADGDELLLRLSFDEAVLEPMRSNRPDYASWTIADKPIVHLLKEIAKRPVASRIYVSSGNVSVELKR